MTKTSIGGSGIILVRINPREHALLERELGRVLEKTSEEGFKGKIFLLAPNGFFPLSSAKNE